MTFHLTWSHPYHLAVAFLSPQPAIFLVGHTILTYLFNIFQISLAGLLN